jgi:hypothetical protein
MTSISSNSLASLSNLPLSLTCEREYAIPHSFDINTRFCGGYLLRRQLAHKHSRQRRSWIYNHGALVYHPSNPSKDRWICTHCNSAGYETTFHPVSSTAAAGHLLRKHNIGQVERNDSPDTHGLFDLDSCVEDNRISTLNAQLRAMDERLRAFTNIDFLVFQRRLVDWIVLKNQSYDGASSLQARELFKALNPEIDNRLLYQSGNSIKRLIKAHYSYGKRALPFSLSLDFID